MSEKEQPPSNEEQEKLLVEYQVAQQMRNSLASLAWQVGAILIGAAVVSLSVSLKPDVSRWRMVALGAVAVAAIIFWLLSIRRHHPWIRLCDQRLRQIRSG